MTKQTPPTLQESPEMQGARTRLGDMLVDHARWLLGRISQDLRGLSAGEWLDLTWEVEAFGLPWNTTATTPMPPDRVLQFLVAVQSGIMQALSGAGWRITETLDYTLVSMTWRGRQRLALGWGGPGTFRLVHAMRCLEAASESGQIRSCARKGCGRLFVPIRRQTFCGAECSQKERWARYTAAHDAAERAALRHDAYARRMQRQTGSRTVKIQRRRQKPA